MNYILRIGLLLTVYAVGMLLFTRGFLLTRVALSANSSCHDAGTSTTPARSVCPDVPRFRRAVLIVVDALRFDFVVDVNDSSICDGGDCAGEQRLRILAEIARERPSNSRLYRFVADPPTTTLQRLKGLTTGSLPTFVDAGANFASTEITEDNFIDQYVRLGKNITFMGDDTWQVLHYSALFATILFLHRRNFTLKSGGDQWRRQDLVSGGHDDRGAEVASIAKGTELGRVWEGCSLPSQLGGFGEHCELPSGVRGGAQAAITFSACFRPQNASGSKKNTNINLELLEKLQIPL